MNSLQQPHIAITATNTMSFVQQPEDGARRQRQQATVMNSHNCQTASNTHDPAKLGETPQQGAASPAHRAAPTAAAQMDEGTCPTRFTFIGSHQTGHFIYCPTFHIPNLGNHVDMQAMWLNHPSNMMPSFAMGNHIGGQLGSGGARHPGAPGGAEFGHHLDAGVAGFGGNHFGQAFGESAPTAPGGANADIVMSGGMGHIQNERTNMNA
ncbi:hypothetical protein F5B21DRAFT_269025 [Xylaria acuta]|nr:hypothetical protein F5B21DRAFT_269025 [Xylaria acuta]